MGECSKTAKTRHQPEKWPSRILPTGRLTHPKWHTSYKIGSMVSD